MYKFITLIAMLMAAVTWTASAQEEGGRQGGGQRGNWDPAAMQARMLERYKTELGSSDEEWTVISPLVADVFAKQRASRELTSMGGGRGGRRGGTTTTEQPEGAKEVTELKAAIDANDTAAIREKVAALRAARAAKEAELAASQKALREVLTPAQEAKLILGGLLD